MLEKIKKVFNDPWRLLLYALHKPVGRVFPDYIYLKLIYRASMHKRLNLKNPQTFNEKMQWLKLYDRKPEYTQMVDKYEAKKYVAERIGDEYIIPTLGVWDKFDDIDFGVLSDQFVLKCTHDSGGLVICRDKSNFDIKDAKIKINKSLKRNYYWHGREWPYKSVKPRIIAEKFLSEFDDEGLTDYKFYCFNGEPEFLYVSKGLEDHSTAQISFYDLEGVRLPFKRSDYCEIETFDKPSNLNDMIDIARRLAQASHTSFIRVDLYSVSSKIYFSELTFFPTSGCTPFEPKEWDYKLGELID